MIVKCFAVVVIICYLFCICQSHKIPSDLEENHNLKEMDKNITSNISFNEQDADISRPDDDHQQHTALYGKWSKWSRCKNCRKFRRKVCISKKCKKSTLYEERPCNNARCRRKYRRRNMNIIQKLQTRDLDEDDRIYSRWTNWSPCSVNCMTRRVRNCLIPGTCKQDRDVQLGYCFVEQTACHSWIQKLLNRQAQKQKLAYDVDASNRKSKKVKYKKTRKCGMPYKTTASSRNNMLKIMGGQITKPTKWPWHAAILNSKKNVFCGGTLISPNWVLTAGHCLRKVLYVRLNEYDLSYTDGNEIEYRITKMFRHQYYNSEIVDNDIALLKLPTSVPLPFACLPKNEALPIKQNCTIVGWGKRHPYAFMGSALLREAQMPIVPKSVCKRSYRRYIITNNMFCAGYKNGGIDTCSGDSGGGFMCLPTGRKYGWTVQGITSFGESCGKKGKYGIYTDVRKYLLWIEKIMKHY